MNVIIQCFIHNPPLRAFFLSDKHNERMCCNETSKCMACQMDILFSQFYNGEITAIAPTGFLWSMWMSCKELVGYAQQDCHEFFIGVLNVLHSNMETSGLSTKTEHSNPHHCNCIVHRVFSGMFRSTLTCLDCNNQTIANDPFLDVSLDVRPVFSPVLRAAAHTELSSLEKGVSSKGSTSGLEISKQDMQKTNTVNVATYTSSAAPEDPAGLPQETHSLYECLNQFTHKERLSSSEYRCSKCKNVPADGKSASLGSLKQLSFKKLPLVLSLQLKRYEHVVAAPNIYQASVNTNAADTKGGKISMIVRFPLELDLTEYTTTGISRRNDSSLGKGSQWQAPNPSYIYTLFAVIVHSGTLNSGHYLCYVRQSGSTEQWFRFDDDKITIAEWSEVSKSEAYMCYYIKKNFEYFK